MVGQPRAPGQRAGAGPREADAGFHMRDAQLPTDRRVRQGHLLPDALHGGVNCEAGLDAHDHEVQCVRQPVGQLTLVVLDADLEPDHGQEVS